MLLLFYNCLFFLLSLFLFIYFSAYRKIRKVLTGVLARLTTLMLAYRGGRKGGTNTAIPHMVAREYRNTASKFSQIPKPQLQMGKS